MKPKWQLGAIIRQPQNLSCTTKTLTSSGHQCIDALPLLNMAMVLHHHMPITSVHPFLCYTQHTEHHLQQ